MTLFFKRRGGVQFVAEVSERQEIIDTIKNEVYRGSILEEASIYDEIELISCILRASGIVQSDFLEYLIEQLYITRRDLTLSEKKLLSTKRLLKISEVALECLKDEHEKLKQQVKK